MKSSKTYRLFSVAGKREKTFLCVFIALVFCWSPCFAQTFTDQTSSLLPPSYVGGQSHWGDYNNDGFVDFNGGDGLWLNNGGTSFTKQAVWVSGPWADYNNDGWLDAGGGDTVYLNTGTLNTTSFTTSSLPSTPQPTRSSVWADFDNNGRVDLYIGGYESPSYQADAIIMNYSSGFVKTWQSPSPFSPARGVAAADFDRDGDQDVYVSNYRLRPNQLWRNDGGGSWTDVASSYNAQAGSGHSIGAAWGDIDNDGNLDLFAGNFSHPGQPQSRFLKNLGPAGGYKFEDMGTGGVGWQESYASPSLGDYDNDGDLDLFFTTVYSGDAARLYRNDGNWNFTDVTASMGLSGLGPTYEASWVDIDNDGDLDLATDGKIFINGGNANHWLKVKLTGDGTIVNSAAIGSQVRITVGGQTLTRQVASTTGQNNQNDMTLHFGLGDYSGLVTLEITAPNGEFQIVAGVAVDQTVAYVVSGTAAGPNVLINGDVESPDLGYDGIATSVQDWSSGTTGSGDNVRHYDETALGDLTTKGVLASTGTQFVGHNFDAGGSIGDKVFSYQSLGTIAADDVGKTFIFTADGTGKPNVSPYKSMFEGDMEVSFRTSITGSSWGSQLGTAASRHVDNDAQPALTLLEAYNLGNATYMPSAGDIGTEVFAVITSILTAIDGDEANQGQNFLWDSAYASTGSGSTTPMPTVTFTLEDHGNGTFAIYATASDGDNFGIAYYNIDLENILTAEDESPMGFDSDAAVLRGFTIAAFDLSEDGALFAAQDTISGNAPDSLIYGIGQTAGTMNTLGTPRGVPWDEMVLIATGTYDIDGQSPLFGDEILANIFTEEWTEGAILEGFVDTANVILVYTYSEQAIPGDFDLDGDVDGVDFFYWQIGYPTASGATRTDGDLDGDGDVDGADFGIWQANYPTALGGAAMTTTPEPATLAVFGLGGALMFLRRRPI